MNTGHPASGHLTRIVAIVSIMVILVLTTSACNMPFGLGEGGIGASPTVDVSDLPPTEPRIIMQKPYPGEELALDGSIELTFDQPVTRTSVENAISFTPEIPFDITWIDDQTVAITPASGTLERAAAYTLTIAAGVSNDAGLKTAEAVTLDVITVGYLQVGEVYPAPTSRNIATDSDITVVFNRPVVTLMVGEQEGPNPLTITPAVDGSGTWLNTSVYQFTPASAFNGSQTYTVKVAAGLTDQTGGVLQEDYTWEFTTMPPEVVTVTPSADEERTSPDTPVQVSFNQPMERSSTEAAFSLTGANDSRVAGSFSWDDSGMVMTFTPSAGLLPYGEMLTATITTSARTLSGQSTLANEVSWTFVTDPLPAVISTTPADGETGIDVYTSIQVFFSSPMDDTSFTDRIVIQPEPEDPFYTYFNSWDRSLIISTYFAPQTTYTITLLPGSADLLGNTISQPFSFSFTTGDLQPEVSPRVPGTVGVYDASRPTDLFVRHVNVSRIDFELAALELGDFQTLINMDYESRNAYQPAQVIREWSITPQTPVNESGYTQVSLASDEGGSLAPGLYLLTVRSPEVDYNTQHILAVSTAALTMKTTFDETFVWATSMPDGTPITNATVTVYDSGFKNNAQGTTDKDGVTRISTPWTQDLWDQTLVVWDDGTNFALTSSQWSNGLDPWSFGYYSQYSQEMYSIYLYTDRPIYRPGQEVFFKGIIRTKDDMTYSIPALSSIMIYLDNEMGENISVQDLAITEFGTFSGSFLLAENASPGYYTARATFLDQSGYLGFNVAEYRAPDFLVTLDGPEEVVAGTDVQVTVNGSFFTGGVVSEADVTWSALATSTSFDYQGPGNYSFYDSEDYSYNPEAIPGFGEVIADGAGTTDAEGNFTITVPATLIEGQGSQRLTIEATITDTEGRPVSANIPITIHSADFYTGVTGNSYVYSPGEEITADVIVVDWDSVPVAGRNVTVELVKVEWNSVLEEDEYGNTAYTWTPTYTSVGTPVTVTTNREGRAEASFSADDGGNYNLVATVTDDAGRQQVSRAYLWVTDSDYIAWRQTNDYQTDLIADKNSYLPGETAKILITSPWQGANVNALITIERQGVLEYEVMKLRSNSTIYELPITAGMAPNVYVNATIIRGANEEDPVMSFRAGMVEIMVEPVEQTLEVTVTPDSDEVGPGDTVTYTIETKDFNGDPVDADVSLALVDLAVLQLAEPNSLPIADFFYREQGAAVVTASPLVMLVDRLTQDLIDEGKGGGGGGGGAFFELRSLFKDTAAWQAHVRTGERGRTEVTITLPDNLTTWRLDARAVTADSLVGQATVDIVANKPLMIRPITPRFFIASDQGTIGAVIHNNTDDDLNVTAELEATGLAILNDEAQVVGVPAGGRIEVSWPVVVDADAEWVDLTFSAESRRLSDVTKPELGDPDNGRMLPVYRYEVPEVVGTAGTLDDAGSRLEGISLPPAMAIEDAQIDLRIENSLSSAAIDGLTYLEHYPYECTEQTVSRFITNAATLEALKRTGMDVNQIEARLKEQIAIGLQRISNGQHVDGGWGWFVEDDSDPLVTAYTLQGLLTAHKAGTTVNQDMINNGLAYLTSQLQELKPLSAAYALNRQA